MNVSLADGTIAHFQVTAVAMYAKDQFPAQQVYAPHGGSALQLVTCGGAFDTHTRSYLSNIVAYTTLVATTPPLGSSPAHATQRVRSSSGIVMGRGQCAIDALGVVGLMVTEWCRARISGWG